MEKQDHSPDRRELRGHRRAERALGRARAGVLADSRRMAVQKCGQRGYEQIPVAHTRSFL